MPDIFSWLFCSTLRTASFTAAAIRSSSTSLSSCIRLSSRVMRLTSWRPVITTLTRPAPDWPVTSALASSSCIFCIFSCICCACFIRPAMPPFIMMLSSGVQGFDGVGADRRAELLDHLLHQRVVVNRLLGLALAFGALARSGLGRGFLFRANQFDAQVDGTPQVLVHRVVQTALLGGIEQRAVRRVQVQQPI